MNKVIIIGRLCSNPELRTTPAGKYVCEVNIAVDRRMAADGSKTADFVPTDPPIRWLLCVFAPPFRTARCAACPLWLFSALWSRIYISSRHLYPKTPFAKIF